MKQHTCPVVIAASVLIALSCCKNENSAISSDTPSATAPLRVAPCRENEKPTASSDGNRTVQTDFYARSLKIDERYERKITFNFIGGTFPIEQKHVFIRIDDPVADVEEHQQAIMKELDVSGKIIVPEPARNGRYMHLCFADGKECAFIWVLKYPDDRIAKMRLEHAKFLALCRISPQHISSLSEKIKQHGFDIDLRDYNEQLSASIVEVLSLHLMGVPFDQFWGSELFEQAKGILLDSQVAPTVTKAQAAFHAKSLKLDGRYETKITFSFIGATFPIEQEQVFIRIDDPVADVEEHQQAIMKELDIRGMLILAEGVSYGRHMPLKFADGRKCSFIWVVKDPDDRITQMRLEHEKYHALCRLLPQHVASLTERIKQHGFDIDLHDYDEELSATIVDVLSLHLTGVPFDDFSGSELVVQAKSILLDSRVGPIPMKAQAGFSAKPLKLDDRYERKIVFPFIGATFPIEQEQAFVRIDDPVADIEKHQQALLKEFDVCYKRIILSNSARYGRHMPLTFADGRRCSFIWVLKDPDERITRMRLEHEKYHALCRVLPQHVSSLSEKIKQHGFDIDLRNFDEELGATIVEVLSYHLMGVPFDDFSGSELVVQAKSILLESQVVPTSTDSSNQDDENAAGPIVLGTTIALLAVGLFVGSAVYSRRRDRRTPGPA